MPEDARRARAFGAAGIGLCRTEHMFLGERRRLVERLILAGDDEVERKAALDALLPLQRADFVAIPQGNGRAAGDHPAHRPAVARVPSRPHRAIGDGRGRPRPMASRTRTPSGFCLRSAGCTRPTRCSASVASGCAWPCPGLVELQVRAIAEAVAQRRQEGGNPVVEIMVPVVGSVQELEHVREEAEAVIDAVASRDRGCTCSKVIGTMIELPRACLTARQIAEAADFFSFGTNDLTQTTWGFSRDDCEASFFPRVHGPRDLRDLAVRDTRPRRSGRPGADGIGTQPASSTPTSSWEYVASTAVTREASISSTTSAWTMCPAHRSGSLWPDWKRGEQPCRRRSPAR